MDENENVRNCSMAKEEGNTRGAFITTTPSKQRNSNLVDVLVGLLQARTKLLDFLNEPGKLGYQGVVIGHYLEVEMTQNQNIATSVQKSLPINNKCFQNLN